ncbi:two-component system, OmpR family, response regulator/two-component system, OmpR family, phosphate regulon response regulator OmpR [Roseovarius azorensis]|uniref:Two-component system, OmpR family, response regulator/two-component system, OmpR family, phosphate regulon response regulator OmpR n=1 Tax=Roseovarius azorensis TaxID=1287727 RepID=A0A1H7N8J7_9RHOB|nr:response regulator transcription factor [Roseovarius azorensis]SEL19227.1 two-component system, OmpR family, response regulator/two-component system, OmpR family, phosphate regulon response regulator OmpR [Roseovarius azorensis]
MTERILVVDDDRQMTGFLERFLTKQGFEVHAVGSATRMGLAMEHSGYDLVLLDVGLPDIDGFEVTRELRRSSRLPIILLTAREDVFDKIIGLELGADDYVSKPFEPRELLARIRSVLRRSRAMGAPHDALPEVRMLRFMGFVLDLPRRQLSGPDDREVALTGMEFSLLKVLAENAGAVVSRDRIMQTVYGNAITVTDRAIDAHVARLRKKILPCAGSESLIRTVHGAGYSLAVQVCAE